MRDKAKFFESNLTENDLKFGKIKIDFANFIIKKLSDSKKIDISLSTEAERYIINFKENFELMEMWIKDAFDFAYFSDFDPTKPLIIIEDWHFKDIELVDNKSNMVKEEVQEDKYRKTYTLLNRLETAANKVVVTHQKLTGSTIGQALETPISAPAISDALKKHSKKIIILMQKYPNRWTLIRSEFKSVTNVLASNPYPQSQTA